mgnify:CR=1 FL=1
MPRQKKEVTVEKIIQEKVAKAEAKKAEAEKKEAAEEIDKKEKVKVEVLKGFGEKFGTEKITDGTVLTLPKKNAVPLVKKGYVKLV